jgi:hypothetical protein
VGGRRFAAIAGERVGRDLESARGSERVVAWRGGVFAGLQWPCLQVRWTRILSTRPAGPPMQAQPSSHSAETSHERPAGNIRSGSTSCHHMDPVFFPRQAAACPGPASTSTYCHPGYMVTFGMAAIVTPGQTMSSSLVLRHPSH